MTTEPSEHRHEFDTIAGIAGILAAIAGVGYAVAFVVLKDERLSAIFLLLAPLFSTLVLVAVYQRLQAVEPGLALWVLLLGFVAGVGASIHGGYDLALSLNGPGDTGLPNSVDPRGILTFGAAGLSLVGAAWLVARSGEFPEWVAPAAAILGIVLIVTYLGRLIVLDPDSALVKGPALVAGILSPLLYLGLGLWLLGFGRRAIHDPGAAD
jgi:hypothetical protein